MAPHSHRPARKSGSTFVELTRYAFCSRWRRAYQSRNPAKMDRHSVPVEKHPDRLTTPTSAPLEAPFISFSVIARPAQQAVSIQLQQHRSRFSVCSPSSLEAGLQSRVLPATPPSSRGTEVLPPKPNRTVFSRHHGREPHRSPPSIALLLLRAPSAQLLALNS